MKEQLINYDTAVIAKEKGFNEPVRDCYVQYVEGKISIKTTSSLYKQNIDHNVKQHSAPTQSLLQKWLREGYKLHINVVSKKNGVRKVIYTVYVTETRTNYSRTDRITFKTYEEALEKGLQEALKLIVV